ncbi:hypothetical protein FSP39_001996 [Pinctada imbricata]|uniref:Flavodoxin-like fold domain-containing protein n=1 Tax=Pinctada imbricata TaxID=66713 RepID=A0AA89BLD8_PINIB|nr:hypothetical protein FSP39_001996 [Pinctada imbricata]
MEQKNVLIVYAHQNPHTSFNAALKDEAIKVFVDNGHNVKMSDLYSQHWDPRATASDFEGLPLHSELSNYFNEQSYATKQGTTSKVIQAEQKKLKEADLVIFQFPVYWFSVPAILKGWFDKVFAVGVTHGFPDNVYENGLMKGKKAMLSLTTGATQEMYSTSGNHGDMNMILWPIQIHRRKLCLMRLAFVYSPRLPPSRLILVMTLLQILLVRKKSLMVQIELEDSKRLLLNDPQSIQTILANYETKLLSYENTVQNLQERMSAMEKENKSKGNVGGSSHDHQGSAVDYLCLPHDPDFSIPENDLLTTPRQGVGLLYGAEYEMNYRNVRFDDVVPCAVCRVQATVLMIPGKSACPQDWKIQYNGLLASNYFNHPGASSYICLDGDPEYVPGTRSHNDNGKLFYPVRTRCGSLECPPYQNDSIVTCVVCAK